MKDRGYSGGTASAFTDFPYPILFNSVFTPLENSVFQHGVKYPEFTRGIKPRVNFLTEFTLAVLL